MIEAIFSAIGTTITQFAGVLGNGFSSLLAIFYTNNAVTEIGLLVLIGLGVAIVWLCFRLVMRLFSVRQR